MCTTGFVIGTIMDDGFGISSKVELVLYILCCIFAPIVISFALLSNLWDNCREEVMEMRFPKFLKTKFKWVKEWKQRRRDFKEAEEKEDEWHIERMGTR